MSSLIYNQILLVSWVLVFCLGALLIIGSSGRIAHSLDLTRYKRSRRLMGLSFVFLAIEEFIQWHFNFRLTSSPLVAALNITCYYLMAILVGMSVISLIEHGYICRRQMARDFGLYGIVVIVVWCAATLAQEQTQFLLFVGCSVVFALETMRITMRFFRSYHHAWRALDNYYSDNMELFTHWIYNSVLFLVFTGLIGSVLAYFTPTAAAVQVVIADAMCLYVFMSMNNYAVNYKEVDAAVTADDEAVSTVTTDDKDASPTSEEDKALKEQLNKWLARKNFLNPEITIDTAARQIGVKRTRLTEYLNNEHNTTFREWINGKRIDCACQIMLDDPDISVADIAAQVGFNSSTYFIRQFSKSKGVTPLQWRKSQTLAGG